MTQRISGPRCLALLLTFGLSVPTIASARPSERGRAMLVLDASGSMWGKLKGRTKIEIAREAVDEMVAGWDAKTDLGMIAYGHRRKGDCEDIEMVIDVGPLKAKSFRKRAKKLKPKGMTPLSESVRRAAAALGHTKQRATVILLSDGKETCAADPCAVGAQLEKEGIQFTAHVIGFDVSDRESKGMRCLAEKTGGMYLDARDADELKEALKDARDASIAQPDKPKLTKATVKVPAEVVEGARFEASWTGPKNRLDRLVIRSADGKRSFASRLLGSKRVGPTVHLFAPTEAGPYIVSYEVEGKYPPLAQAELKVIPAKGFVRIPAMITQGSQVAVEWSGPKASGDRLAMVRRDSGKTVRSIVADKGVSSPVSMTAPEEPGEYELHLKTNKQRVLARAVFRVETVKASIRLSKSTVSAGQKFEVHWTGSAGHRISLYDSEGKRRAQRSAKKKSKLSFKAPKVSGTYEVRLELPSGTALATTKITVR